MDKILIIHDSPAVNMLLESKLRSHGFSVETAPTGKEGIEKASAAQFQLILLDYKLPDIDGSQVCRILRQEKGIKGTPIVFISAMDEDEISRILRFTEADGFIALFEGKEFIEKVKNYIRG